MRKYCDAYIESFGETTEKQKIMIRKTLGYEISKLADAVEDLKKVTLESLKGIIKRNRG